MHAVLLTLLTLSGADPAYATMPPPYPGMVYGAGCAGCESGMCGGACGAGPCGASSGHGSHYERRVNRQLQRYMSGRKSGPMPQTCYAPRFGCYHGNRHMHRYPAFHGTYYRRPYNYRNLFEYPWHAEMHEPTSYFSYNVPPEALMPEAMPLPQGGPPMPNEASFPARALPITPQPATQPIFAPQGNKSASYTPSAANESYRVLAPPRLSDQDLAGVPLNSTVEPPRLVPAPIESTADATPYVEGPIAAPQETAAVAAQQQTTQAASDFAPHVSSRPLSAGPRMLQPLEHEASDDSRPVEARPISSRRLEPADVAPPQAKAKPISLQRPQSLVGHSVPSAIEMQQVQPASANQPIARPRTAAPAKGDINPLRQ